jgi:hypothetical protein
MLNQQHSPEVLQFASTMMFFSQISTAYGDIGERNMRLLSHIASPYMQQRGITLDEVERAIDGMTRAHTTLKLIASYGD